jgi:hypothetical protein
MLEAMSAEKRLSVNARKPDGTVKQGKRIQCIGKGPGIPFPQGKHRHDPAGKSSLINTPFSGLLMEEVAAEVPVMTDGLMGNLLFHATRQGVNH